MSVAELALRLAWLEGVAHKENFDFSLLASKPVSQK